MDDLERELPDEGHRFRYRVALERARERERQLADRSRLPWEGV